MIVCGITGHTGNLGKSFIKRFKHFKYDKFKGDITSKKDISKWVNKKNFDLILHFASIVPTSIVLKNYKQAENVNYNGTRLLINAIKKNDIKLKWFFFSSTSHIYKISNNKIKETNVIKPISSYGLTKFKAEQYIIKELSKTNIKFCIGRIFSIFDNKDKNFLIPSLIKKISNKKSEIILENLNHYRDFLSTKQISEIINLLFKKKYKGIINIASGHQTFLKDIGKFIAKIKKKKLIFYDSKKVTKIIANTDKLKKIKWKSRKLNLSKYLN